MAAVGTFARTPYSLLLPGQSLDLRRVIAVRGYLPPRERFDMTDVSFLPNVSPFALLLALRPAAHLVRSGDVVPRGVSDDQYDRAMVAAMTESQQAAVYVAERAAGLASAPMHSTLVIVGFAGGSRARGALKSGDTLLAVSGRAITGIAALHAALAKLHPGDRLRLTYARAGATRTADVTTTALRGETALGVYLAAYAHYPKATVPVTFSLDNVSGSSGGLMFAIDIYRTLRPRANLTHAHVAGTGTLDASGNVGPIEGALQKETAAARAGATVFLVPAENAADLRGVRGMRVVAVHTFKQALEALSRE